MKIYFTASTSFNGQLLPTYKKIIKLIKNHRVKIISGQQIVNKKQLKKDKKLSKKQIFKRQKKLIDQADCLIAEITKPSIGVGGEITYALTKNKPVLALIEQNFENKISPMLAGNPSDNLFLEFYNHDKLKYILNEFISHMRYLKKKKGKLIVIDGGDGSGKTTQAKLLLKYLKKKKIPTKYVDFPQYYLSFHGKTIAKFLRGEFGSIDQVSPYLASLAYALDRASVKQEMEEFLEKGGFIIANRYASSNIAHQGSKFSNKKERKEFVKWIYELEYKVHKIPKEDLVIYLYIPWKKTIKLIEKKPDRKYLKGQKKDIHEKDDNYLKKTEEMYLSLTKTNKHWKKINSIGKNHKLLSKQEIHQKILTTIKSLIPNLTN